MTKIFSMDEEEEEDDDVCVHGSVKSCFHASCPKIWEGGEIADPYLGLCWVKDRCESERDST